jgi:excisionase family DNA binding protein
MNTLCFLTPQEVAELLNLRLETVYRSLRSGRLPHFRFGRQYRITKEQLLEYMTPRAR